MAANQTEKIHENRLRRMAGRQGLRLVKSRRRDPRAIDYGGYMLIDLNSAVVVAGTGGVGRPHWRLADVERYLLGEPGKERHEQLEENTGRDAAPQYVRVVKHASKPSEPVYMKVVERRGEVPRTREGDGGDA